LSFALCGFCFSSLACHFLMKPWPVNTAPRESLRKRTKSDERIRLAVIRARSANGARLAPRFSSWRLPGAGWKHRRDRRGQKHPNHVVVVGS